MRKRTAQEVNMDWREEYKRKLTSAEDAMKAIGPGQRVVIPIAGPRVLTEALYRRGHELGGIQLRLSAPAADPGWLQPGVEQLFKVEIEVFIGDFARPAHDERVITYLPNLFTTMFKPLDEGRPERKDIDVVLVNVSPPDEEGRVYFGVHNWNKRSYVRRAKTVIAEVDPSIQPVCGQNFVHVSEIDYFVEVPPLALSKDVLKSWLQAMPDQELRQEYESIVDELEEVGPEHVVVLRAAIPRGTPPDLVRRAMLLAEPPPEYKVIAGYLSEIVPNGATIQIGVGEPSMYMVRAGAFEDKEDLGIHTEMACPGLAMLAERGIATGRKKSIHQGKAVAGAWTGSDAKDMKVVIGNPRFEVYEVEYVLNLRTLAQIDNFYAINNAISIDLIGQINSESVFGPRMINGTGGQPEAHLGAILSRGGRAITLLPSTALGGTVSRIVPMHEEGSIVTIPRFFADTVITEYGVARLMGKNHRERAQELIAIAHPDFRAELRRQAQRLW
jgi:4-hydroxybutyrate CoA-transferase